MKNQYHHEVIRHARAVITASHTQILAGFVDKEVTVSSVGRRSVLASRLELSNGLYKCGRFSFTAEQVLSLVETPVGDSTVLLIHI